ncbi:DUF3108 domain-containing protein [Pseudidiomarina sp. CB1]|uniref:DUF3108 domain-containing protein n=1 Tax=Pseudidiomarina sp. CB1 TaxID=2972484 RepID=UPI002162F30F|nr:DUF3108 domain-containing protein [Pseudidiomarina sp. CB1]
MKRRVPFLSLSLLLVSSVAVAVEKQPELSTYDARYEVQRGGSNYGEALRTLVRDDSGRYQLENETEISFLFLSDVRRYDSTFGFSDGRVEPQTFAFKRSGTGRNKGIRVRFDTAAKQVIDVEAEAPLPVTWHAGLLDEASMLEQLRYELQHTDAQDFSFQIIDDKGSNDLQKFRRGAIEQLSLPYGDIAALKVERVRESKKRETIYWFAPELDYVLVKMQQRKEGDEVATLLLQQLD